ncbi:MAG: hypothetical protein Q4C35_01520, partial [Eubacteriales bacterium]|nr:hypothetical protein [Eubacteriales bacterium]
MEEIAKAARPGCLLADGKARLRRSFPPRIAPFAYSLRSPGGERRKEALLRKASETGVHAAGFGT